AGGFARRLQYRHDLDRVMAVIVDHRYPTRLAGLGEAPFDAAEARQRLDDDGVAEMQFLGDGDGGERVLDIVRAEHRQTQAGDGARRAGGAPGDGDVIARAVAAQLDIDGADIGLR